MTLKELLKEVDTIQIIGNDQVEVTILPKIHEEYLIIRCFSP